MKVTIKGGEAKRIMSLAKSYCSEHGRLLLSVSTSDEKTKGVGIAYLTNDYGYKQIFFNCLGSEAGTLKLSMAANRIGYLNYPAIDKVVLSTGRLSVHCQSGEVYTHTMREE